MNNGKITWINKRTGNPVQLTPDEVLQAEKSWESYKAGGGTKPSYRPVAHGSNYIGRPKPRRKGERSYREFCR